MKHLGIYFFIFAAVHTAAFFLVGETKPVANYIHGKIEVISEQENPSSQNTISTLRINDHINLGDLICTGKGSRSEFSTQFGEEYLYTCRLGSQSVMSWTNRNTIFLHSGSFLYTNSNTSQINVSSIEANASFKGSGTIIIEATQNGGFKFIPIEARGTLTTDSGGTIPIKSGRMILVLGNPTYFGDAYDFDLMLLIKTSRLINSYPNPLESFGRISLSVYSQELKLKGKYNALIGDAISDDKLQLWTFGENNLK